MNRVIKRSFIIVLVVVLFAFGVFGYYFSLSLNGNDWMA